MIQRNFGYAGVDPTGDLTLSADPHFTAFCGGAMPDPPDMEAAYAAAPEGLPD